MSQFFRVSSKDVCSVVRSYSTQRFELKNHYETLKVSPNASQKEIRQAFIKLSKQLHPDISGKKSHVDFVNLNEAYSVLGKENTRRLYDMQLHSRCQSYRNTYQDSYAHNYSQERQYGSRWEYEVRTAGGPWPPPNLKPNAVKGLVIALLLFALGIFQFFSMMYSWKVRQYARMRNEQLQRRYEHVLAKASTNSKNIHKLNELTDLNHFFVDNTVEYSNNDIEN